MAPIQGDPQCSDISTDARQQIAEIIEIRYKIDSESKQIAVIATQRSRKRHVDTLTLLHRKNR